MNGVEEKKFHLDMTTKICYGLGHIMNDIGASIWYPYALIFFKLGFSSRAFLFILLGQTTDAVATVVCGLLFDTKVDHLALFRLGKYRTWYMLGTVIMGFFFPVAFSELALIYTDTDFTFGIYMWAVIAAQIGWSFVQICHLSLISEISITASDRVWLTSIRQAASIYSSIVVFLLYWYTLSQSTGIFLGKSDIMIFANNSYVLTIFGLLHSIVFFYTIRENRLKNHKAAYLASIQPNDSLQNKGEIRLMDTYTAKDWFQDKIFYKVLIVYMLSRLYIQLPVTYLPLYLQETLHLNKDTIATIPLLIFISGLVFSFISNLIENTCGNKFHMLLGIILGMAASFWSAIGSCHSEQFKMWHIYLIAILLGITFTILKIGSINVVADMIGQNQVSISFVYGAVSCVDKVVGGVVISIIEQFNKNQFVHDRNATDFSTTINPFDTASTVYFGSNWTTTLSPDICPDGYKSTMFYYYIFVYGALSVLVILLVSLCSIVNVDFRSNNN